MFDLFYRMTRLTHVSRKKILIPLVNCVVQSQTSEKNVCMSVLKGLYHRNTLNDNEIVPVHSKNLQNVGYCIAIATQPKLSDQFENFDNFIASGIILCVIGGVSVLQSKNDTGIF